MLRYILLGFLNYRPMTGYELKSIMDESTMHFWHAYHSQIYTTLRKLEQDGRLVSELLEDDEKLNKRLYTITESGIAELQSWMNTPPTEHEPVKIEMLVRIFFSGMRPKADVLDDLRLQRHLHQQKLAYYRALTPTHLLDRIMGDTPPPTARREGAFWLATLNFGTAYEELYLRWLDDTIAAVEAS